MSNEQPERAMMMPVAVPLHLSPSSLPFDMTLRDYFAGQALAGLLAEPGWTDIPHMSTLAYKFADAMIAARDY